MSDDEDKPKYVHDCDHCKFLGRFNEYDLYCCIDDKNNNLDTTVIARHGPDGDYMSGLPFIKKNPLREAALRAIEAGHLDPKIETGGAGQGTVGEYLTKTMAADSAAT